MSTDKGHSIMNTAGIGIMGGTFNPIHYGHLLLAENAREVFGLDRILFMPSGNSYMKNVEIIADGSARARMIELAIQGNPHFYLSRMELDRPGPTYTCDTLRELRENCPENQYFFLMGSDNLFGLKKWKDYKYILQNCILGVAVRGGEKLRALQEEADRLKDGINADIRFLPERNYEISSTEIRDRILENKTIRYLLPASVEDYIREHALYCDK